MSKLIKLTTAGTYGHNVNGRIIPKTAKDDPFEVTDEQAKRLIRLNAAEIVSKKNAAPPKDKDDKAEGGDPADLSKLKKPQLQALAEDMGIEFSDKTTAPQLIELITASKEVPSGEEDGTGEEDGIGEEDDTGDEAENVSEEDDGTPPPELTPQDVIANE